MTLMAPSSFVDLASLRSRVTRVVDEHPVVAGNGYTRWFARGEASVAEVRHLTVQFSVFSHQFVEAQLRKVMNAPSLDAYHAGKEILLNELGVVFRPPRQRVRPDDDADPELVSTEGSVEGSHYRHGAAHFEWLLRFAAPLGLGFDDLGKRRHGTPATLFFCDELLRVYGADDPSTSEGASYAVEHWAAAGFWKELITGLDRFCARERLDLPLAFWTWHDKVEDQHAQHTEDELEQAVSVDGFDQHRFLDGARRMLDGVHAFWSGLYADHLAGRAR
jgi:pyrroloquinoline quinone (PQQ) biosynthesis protein C